MLGVVNAPPLIVIFGALVRPDGRPSAALLRRTGYGLAASRAHPDAPILCSGGAPRPGPTEASIMARVLSDAGVAGGRLILDEVSLDTLGNVAAATAQVLAGGHPHVIACTDGYHLPRVRLLLALEGVASVRGPVPRGPAGAPLAGWVAMSAREGLAIPYGLLRRLIGGAAAS